MRRKYVFFLISIALILTGCVKIDNNYDNIINNTITSSSKAVNRVSTGYQLFIPIGVRQVIDNEFNQKLKIKDKDVYLYVDTISYYYKNKLNLLSDKSESYYYKDINNGDKSGYVNITKNDDKYFCVIVYNYAKIEFYSDSDNLPYILTDSLIILNSIKYNDSLIEKNLSNSLNDGREIKFELDKPDDSVSTFSQELQEYVEQENNEVELPDEE